MTRKDTREWCCRWQWTLMYIAVILTAEVVLTAYQILKG